MTMIDRIVYIIEQYKGEASDEFLARQIVEAMREPTDKMCEACQPDEDGGLIWRDMIAAALAEK